MIRAEMMARMSYEEFMEWMIFDSIEPFGDRRADIHIGIIRATLANLFARKNESSPVFQPEDMTPKFGPQPERPAQTPEQMKMAMMMLMEASQKLKKAVH
jgi:hypothetical protein